MSKVDILIVDDRLDGLIALEAVLGGPEINLVKAMSGREALSRITKYNFAVIILDVQMPELDGFETAELIRKNENYKQTPIIFVTAINKDDRHIHKGYAAGAVDYVFKPIDPQVLKSKVNIFIDLFLKTQKLQEQAELIRESERRIRYLKLAELEMESLKRYRNLADAVPHLIWKSKPDGSHQYANKIWTNYTGLNPDQSSGSGWQQAINPDDLTTFLKAWMNAMNDRQGFENEIRIKRIDGEYRWHTVHVVPEMSITDEITAWIGAATDIHDLKHAQKEAMKANVAKTNFLANMSHEIRTPLSAIMGLTEIMLGPDHTEEEYIGHVSTIRRSGEQLLRIIDEILDISKIEAGHLEVEHIELNLLGLLSEVQSLLEIQAKTKNIELKLNLKNKVPEFIFSDPTRLRQIITNMVSNAIKFTESGTVTVECQWVERKGIGKGKLQIRILDTGVGISIDQAAKLFKPFVQVDSSTTRKFGGTGLGLALSRQLAQALGGDVTLESSEPHSGSVFLIEIEAAPKANTRWLDKLRVVSEDVEAFTENDSHLLDGMNILLVEDAPINQAIISRFLKSAGATVDLANNGVEGVSKAMSGSYKVVLMDIQMPELDGYEAVSQLRRKGFKPPIIALTAHALKEERDRCLRVGCNEHLTKPVNRKTLISQVARVSEQLN